MDVGLDFALRVYEPSVDDITSGGEVEHAVGIFDPDPDVGQEHAAMLVADPGAPLEVWKRIDLEFGNRDMVRWYMHPNVPREVRSQLVTFLGSRLDEVADRLDVDDLNAVIEKIESMRWHNLDEPKQMLQACRGEIAARFAGPDQPPWVRESVAANPRIDDATIALLSDEPDGRVVAWLLPERPAVALTAQQWERLLDPETGPCDLDLGVAVRCKTLPPGVLDRIQARVAERW